MANNARAIEHIAADLTDDGVLFGGTVLGPSADHTAAGRAFLWLANLRGAFGNRDDDIEGLRSILDASLEKVEVTAPSDTIAYFVASRPRTVRGKNGGLHGTERFYASGSHRPG